MSLKDQISAAKQSPGYWKECFDLAIEQHVKDAARLNLLERVAEAARTVFGGRYLDTHDMTLMLIVDGPERDALFEALKALDAGRDGGTGG